MNDKLTIQELAAYLPYKVNVSNYDWTEIVEVTLFNIHDAFIAINNGHFRLVLRNLSDLTKEIEHNGERFVPLLKLYEMSIFNIYKHIAEYKVEVLAYDDTTFGLVVRDIDDRQRNGFTLNVPYEYGFQFEFHLTLDNENSNSFHSLNQYDLFQKLLEWHFDIFNLIPNNLAIDINTLKQ